MAACDHQIVLETVPESFALSQDIDLAERLPDVDQRLVVFALLQLYRGVARL